jgi:energy-coupling factor transporter ATP-binding protein EcfA2
MPQRLIFIPSVKEEVESSLKNLGLPTEVISERCEYIREDIGISHLKDRSPHMLSFE